MFTSILEGDVLRSIPTPNDPNINPLPEGINIDTLTLKTINTLNDQQLEKAVELALERESPFVVPPILFRQKCDSFISNGEKQFLQNRIMLQKLHQQGFDTKSIRKLVGKLDTSDIEELGTLTPATTDTFLAIRDHNRTSQCL